MRGRHRIIAALRLAVLGVLLATLAGCSMFGGEPKDGPPPRQLRAADIDEPTPRSEPRSRYGNGPTYTVLGRTYRVLDSAQGYQERGIASWYGSKFHGQPTSSQEPYDMYKVSAAHRTLPLPTYVRVTNLENGRSLVVRVNDRGPFKDNRIIDLSYAAAVKLGIDQTGTGLVEVRAIDPDRPVPQALPTLTSATQAPQIFLQVGAFVSRHNAETLVSRLRGQGFAPVQIQSGSDAGREFHRVRLGPIAAVEEADRLAQRLQNAGFDRPDIRVE